MRKLIVVLLATVLWAIPLSAQTNQAELILDHDGGVVSASWSSDETRIVTASEEGVAIIWSATDGEQLQTIDHNGNPLTHALWFGDDVHIVSADESGLVQYADAETGEIVQSWQIDGTPLALEISADESSLFVFTSEGNGAIWTIDGEEVAAVSRSGRIIGADWSADETQIRAYSEDGRIVVWDVATGETLATFSLAYRGILLGIGWNDDDSRMLAWYADGRVIAYETDGVSVNQRGISDVQHGSFVQQAIFSMDGSRVMSWSGDDNIRVWATASGQAEFALPHEDWVVGAIWNDTESQIMSWSHIYVYIWNSTELSQQFEHDNLVRGAIFNSDSTQILSWSWDGTARVWEF